MCTHLKDCQFTFWCFFFLRKGKKSRFTKAHECCAGLDLLLSQSVAALQQLGGFITPVGSILQTCPEVLNCLSLYIIWTKTTKLLSGSCTSVALGLYPPVLKYLRMRKFAKTLRGRKKQERRVIKMLSTYCACNLHLCCIVERLAEFSQWYSEINEMCPQLAHKEREIRIVKAFFYFFLNAYEGLEILLRYSGNYQGCFGSPIGNTSWNIRTAQPPEETVTQ